MKGFEIQQVGIYYKLKPAIEPKSISLLGTFLDIVLSL